MKLKLDLILIVAAGFRKAERAVKVQRCGVAAVAGYPERAGPGLGRVQTKAGIHGRRQFGESAGNTQSVGKNPQICAKNVG